MKYEFMKSNVENRELEIGNREMVFSAWKRE
jgi:hypothetical protein